MTSIRWMTIVAIAWFAFAVERGYTGHWPEAQVWASGAVLMAVLSLHDRR